MWLQEHPDFEQICAIPVALGITCLYVVSGILGNKWMASREPMALTRLKLVYNATQVIVCTITFTRLLPFFSTAEHGYGIGITSQSEIEKWVFVYYCCKLLDFGDTMFMVLGKRTRQFTVLHVWHHASIVPLFSFYLSSGRGGGFIAALPLWNSLIHMLMYTHYLATSLVKFERMWWKPILTASQMGHHCVIMMYMVLNYAHGNPECTWQVAASAVAWGLSILGLFAQFYVQSYFTGRQKKADQEVTRDKKQTTPKRRSLSPKKQTTPAQGSPSPARPRAQPKAKAAAAAGLQDPIYTKPAAPAPGEAFGCPDCGMSCPIGRCENL